MASLSIPAGISIERICCEHRAPCGSRPLVRSIMGLARESAWTRQLPFSEVWHLVKPSDDSRTWAIAGIQQAQ